MGFVETYYSYPQLFVRAYDPEYPDDYALETVTINVARNEYSPQFDRQAYTVTINETEPVGTNILTLTASDQNSGVKNV